MVNSKIKYFKIGNYLLAISPLFFIISALSFYIYYGIILKFWGISGINPNEYPEIKIYSFMIIYSWIFTFLSIIPFIFSLLLILNYKLWSQLKKTILIICFLYILSTIIVFSKIFEFAMD